MLTSIAFLAAAAADVSVGAMRLNGEAFEPSADTNQERSSHVELVDVETC